MALTDAERERCRYHLGYPNISATTSIQFGLPAQRQMLFVLEQNLTNIIPSAEPRVRQQLGILDNLECRLTQAQQYLVAEKLGEMTLAENHPDKLEKEYTRWAQRLSDEIGSPLYAFSARFRNTGGAAGLIPIRRG